MVKDGQTPEIVRAMTSRMTMVVSLMSSEILDQVVEPYDIIAVAEALDVPASRSLFADRLWTTRLITPTLALSVPGASVTAPSYRTLGGLRGDAADQLRSPHDVARLMTCSETPLPFRDAAHQSKPWQLSCRPAMNEDLERIL